MAVIWNLIIDEEDFTRRVQKEIYRQKSSSMLSVELKG